MMIRNAADAFEFSHAWLFGAGPNRARARIADALESQRRIRAMDVGSRRTCMHNLSAIEAFELILMSLAISAFFYGVARIQA